MLEYGLSGSATYSLELTGLDEMMQFIPNNDVNQISARNIRDIVYTLWLNGGGGSEFFYTQGPPLTEKSTAKVGGVLSNRNYENVSLQVLFDTMFFEAVPNEYSITGSGSFEFGFPSPGVNPTINFKVNLSQKNETPFIEATVTRTSAATPAWTSNGVLTPNPVRPGAKGESKETPYNSIEVHQNWKTTFTLNVTERGPKVLPAKGFDVTWFYRRFWGYLNLSTYGSFFQTFDATPIQEQSIRGGISREVILGSSQSTTQLKEVPFGVPGTTNHIWLAWPITDYGGTGVPSEFQDALKNPLNFFREIDTRSFTNQYSHVSTYKIFISNLPSGSSTYFVNGAAATKG
jgi:hypothetical protein